MSQPTAANPEPPQAPQEMATDLPPVSTQSSPGQLRLGVSVVVIVLVGVGTLIFLASTMRRRDTAAEQEQAAFRREVTTAITQLQQRSGQSQPTFARSVNGETGAPQLDTASVPMEPNDFQRRQQAQRDLIKNRREAFDERLKELSTEIAAAEAQRTAILTSVDGRKLASSPELVEKCAVLFELERPSEATVRELQAEFDLAVTGGLSTRERSGTSTPAWLADLNDLDQRARESLSTARGGRLLMTSLAAEVAAAEPADITLQQAIDQWRAEKQRRQFAEIKRARDEADAAAAKRIAAAESEAIRLKADSTVKLTADAARNHVERAADQALREQLRARARTPEVRRYLAAFIEPGYTQPISAGDRVWYEKTAELGPMSFARIQTLGGLDDGLEGLRKLNMIAKNNERASRWNYSEYEGTWPNDAIPSIKHVQKLLRELGPTLVEEKLLAP